MKKYICLIAVLLAPAIASAGGWDNDTMEQNRRIQQEQSSRELEQHFRQMERQQEYEQQKQQLDQIERNQERMERQIQERNAAQEHRRYLRTFGVPQ
jgi:Tfp pilus assembly protein PilO